MKKEKFNLKKSVLLTSTTEIDEITDVLAIHFGITYFGYIKLFKDRTHFMLCNNPNWIEHFYQNYFEHGVFHKTIDAYTSGFTLWSTYEDQTTFTASREYFDLAHGITLIEKQKDFCEFFTFGTTSNNEKIINFYLNNLDLLKRFSLFFKERGNLIINKANKDRLILPNCLKAQKNEDKEVIPTIISEKIREEFIAFTTLKPSCSLTKKESLCLYYLSQGKSLKEVARQLNISPRTVESHLNNLKLKLGARNKTELIIKSLEEKFQKERPW